MDSKLQRFLTQHLTSEFSYVPIAGDASTRKYFRVFSKPGNYIACFDPQFVGLDPEKYLFSITQQLFHSIGSLVPQVYALSSESGLLLLEDLGDDLLESWLQRQNVGWVKGENDVALSDEGDGLDDEVKIVKMYSRILDEMVLYQTYPPNLNILPYQISFNVEKLMFEFNFFLHYALGFDSQLYDSSKRENLRKAFLEVSGLLDKPNWFVLNHRDLHCRNIILRKDKIYLIDFQDARMGLPQYDLASLLKDSYIALPKNLIDSFVNEYFFKLSDSGYNKQSKEEFLLYFYLMAWQRNIKALGTFYYQLHERHNRRYLDAIVTTKKYLYNDYSQILSEMDGFRKAMDILHPFLKMEI